VLLNHNKLKVVCPERDQICEDNYFVLFPQINYSYFRIQITLDDFDNQFKNSISDLRFWMYTANPEYTVFLLALRYTLLAISIVMGIYYATFYVRMPKSNRTSEHNNLIVLTIALVCFNDPFYAQTVLKGTIFWVVLSTFCVTAMIAILISFFAMTFQRIYREGMAVTSTQCNAKNIGIGVIAFLLCSTTGLVAAIYTRFDPGVHANTE